MTDTALSRLLDALTAAGCNPRQTGASWSARCPAHDDRAPSLSVSAATEFPGAVVHCHAGCDRDAVLDALSLSTRDLFDEPKAKAAGWTVVAEYPYVDEQGTVLFTVERRYPKDFRQYRPDGHGGKIYKLGTTRRVLYRLPEVIAAVAAGRTVHIVEGEKDVHRLLEAGVVATCNPGGAGKWRSDYATSLAGADVVVVADRDQPGRTHARTVGDSLTGVAASVRIAEPAQGKDVTDHLAAGRTLDQLVEPQDHVAVAGPDDAFAAAVDEQAQTLRIRHAARLVVEEEQRQAVDVPPFDAGLLSEILARPAEPPHRIDGLLPSDAGMLVVAQRKTGKTTFQLNLARSLLTGETFLGRFDVRPVEGTVALINFEVGAAQLARWAADAGVPAGRLYLVNLRGRRNPLGHPADRQQLADQLHQLHVETLLVDPFGRAYNGQSQNDPGEVGAWLADLDRFARGDVGATDLILSAHAGWDGERTRGASALEDWADSIVTLVRDKEDESQRYLRATGRDVDIDEDRLTYDHDSRRLLLAGRGSRRAAAAHRKVDELVQPLVDLVTETPGLTVAQLGTALKLRGYSFQRGDEGRAARQAAATGLLRVEEGGRNSRLHYPNNEPSRATPNPPGGTALSPPEPSLYVGRAQKDGSPASPPNPSEHEKAALRLVADRLGAHPIEETP